MLKKSYMFKLWEFFRVSPTHHLDEWKLYKKEVRSIKIKLFLCSPPPQQKHFLVMECFSRDSGNEKSQKTCDTRGSSFIENLESARPSHSLSSLHLPNGRAKRRAHQGQEKSARSWVPGGPHISPCVHLLQEINFHFPANSPLSKNLVTWSQLTSPGSISGIRRVTSEVPPSEHSSPSCSNTSNSEHYIKLQELQSLSYYKQQCKLQSKWSLSATGSSKTLSKTKQVGNSTVQIYPYKTLQ